MALFLVAKKEVNNVDIYSVATFADYGAAREFVEQRVKKSIGDKWIIYQTVETIWADAVVNDDRAKPA